MDTHKLRTLQEGLIAVCLIKMQVESERPNLKKHIPEMYPNYAPFAEQVSS